MKPITILDTFAGIGGFSYAADKLVGGFKTTQFIEINPFCQKILNKHWPTIPIHDDIKTFTAGIGQFDCITGGFPCQDLSVAGRQAGITKESRSGLFYELMRVIRMVRPRFVVMENVAAILNNGLDIVLGELSQAGYDAEWAVISASSLGAAHRRSRWWCVAYTDSFGCGRGNSERCSIQERTFFSGKQGGSKMGSQTKRCSSQSPNPYNNGLPSSSINEIYDETNSSSQERQNQVSKSSRGSKSSDSRIIQSSTKLTNPNSERLQRQILSKMERGLWTAEHTRRLNPNWRQYVSKPILPRGSDGLSNRVDRTRALGNSIVPAVAAIPLKRVYDLYNK